MSTPNHSPLPKFGACYDGSSEWSIGFNPDPQGNPICHVWDKNDNRAKSKVDLILDSLNANASLLQTNTELVEALEDILKVTKDFTRDGKYMRDTKALWIYEKSKEAITHARSQEAK